MNTYDPARIGEYIKDIKESGKSTAAKAEELGCSVSTLYSGIQRARKKKKPGPKVKAVEVIDIKRPKANLTVVDRLAIIEDQLNAVRDTLRSIQ